MTDVTIENIIQELSTNDNLRFPSIISFNNEGDLIETQTILTQEQKVQKLQELANRDMALFLGI